MINDEVFELLVKEGRFDASKPLRLDGSAITDKSISLIQGAKDIESVGLSKTGVTDESLKILGTFSRLNLLRLKGCKVTGKGLGFVARLPIKELDLADCDLDEGHFQAIGQMVELNSLKMDSRGLTQLG